MTESENHFDHFDLDHFDHIGEPAKLMVHEHEPEGCHDGVWAIIPISFPDVE